MKIGMPETKTLNLAYIFTVLALTGLVFLPAKKTFAQEVALTPTSTSAVLNTATPSSTPSTTLPTVLGLQSPAIPPFISAVKNAKAKLAQISLNHTLSPIYKNVKDPKTKKIVKKITGYNLTSKTIALAILDPATQNISVVIGKQSGKNISFSDPNISVNLTSFNGVNSKFSVTQPPNGKVIALKYLITGPESGSKTKIENGLSEAIYVPYSADFAQSDVLAYGANYLAGIVNKVAADLQNLPSQAVPGLTVTQAIKPSLIKALVYAEHTDTTQVLVKNDVQSTIDQLNILFALNEGDTYKYSVSKAGARGIAQFIPSTYQSLVSRHPEASLNPDFVMGMSDHENAIKAMYLLLDDYAGAVRVKASNGFASGRVFDYGAASYNGGTARVAKAVNAFGDNWNQDRNGLINDLKNQASSLTAQIKSLKKKIAADKKNKTAFQTQLNKAQASLADVNNQLSSMQSATLRPETVNYIQKIYKVIQFFNSEQQA